MCPSLRSIEPPSHYKSQIATVDVLDGAMITLAIYTINLVHPGHFLHDPQVADEPLTVTQNVDKYA
jgi:hypothetical protein